MTAPLAPALAPAAQGWGLTEVRAAQAAAPQRLVVLGDSITLGHLPDPVLDPSYEAWPVLRRWDSP